uniref:GED domain-containing protein n=1 Tax=Ananas comosus var. bracteatus TaxID=296719 RepID=A0A6V7Q3Y2_ANACO|nr:unnamed protein product [Ananas comosus var. bracteatus]
MRVLFHILKQARETLEKILVRGEFDDFPDDSRLHGTARVAEMLHKYAAKLPQIAFGGAESDAEPDGEDAGPVGRVRGRDDRDGAGDGLHVESGLREVLLRDGAAAGRVYGGRQGRDEAAEGEREGEVGEVDVAHLRQHREVAEQAFEMRVRLAAYWRSVVLRIVDGAALHVQRSIRRVVERELEAEVVREAVGRAAAGIDRMLEEGPATAAKRERLKKRIELLRQSKDVVANITDRIAIDI